MDLHPAQEQPGPHNIAEGNKGHFEKEIAQVRDEMNRELSAILAELQHRRQSFETSTNLEKPQPLNPTDLPTNEPPPPGKDAAKRGSQAPRTTSSITEPPPPSNRRRLPQRH